MNILLLNHTWLSTALRNRGHQVVSAGIFAKQLDVNIERPELGADELLRLLPAGFVPDRIVYFDDSGVPWLSGLEELKTPKVFYSVDTHHHHGWHGFFSALFDHVLVAQKKYLPTIAEHNRRSSWFPPWATQSFEPSPEKTIDVCFRGTLDPKLNPRRTVFFEELSRLIPGDYGPGDYTLSYPRAKIVVNQIVADDLNFRVFEALMAGALLVTPAESTGLTDLFVPGEDLLVYHADDASSAAEQIRWALSHEAERKRIAERGRAKLLAAHTKEHRAAQLEDILNGLASRNENPLLHFSAAQSYFFSVLVSELHEVGLRRGLLRAASDNFIQSLKLGEPAPRDLTISTVLHLAAKLRQLAEADCEVPLFAALQDKFPKSLVAALGLIEALLHEGRTEDAKKIAEIYNPGDADTLLAQVPALMDQTRKEMLGAETHGQRK